MLQSVEERMGIDRARRRFLVHGTVVAATFLAGGRVSALERPSRKITVFRNPT